MRARVVASLCPLAWVVVLIGCGPNKGDQIFDVRRDVALAYCECDALLATTRDACVADVMDAQPTEDERRCIRRIYDRNGPAVDEPASCTLDAAKSYQACVTDAACDEAALRACEDGFDDDTATCEPVPEDIQAELSACFS